MVQVFQNWESTDRGVGTEQTVAYQQRREDRDSALRQRVVPHQDWDDSRDPASGDWIEIDSVLWWVPPHAAGLDLVVPVQMYADLIGGESDPGTQYHRARLRLELQSDGTTYVEDTVEKAYYYVPEVHPDPGSTDPWYNPLNDQTWYDLEFSVPITADVCDALLVMTLAGRHTDYANFSNARIRSVGAWRYEVT